MNSTQSKKVNRLKDSTQKLLPRLLQNTSSTQTILPKLSTHTQ